MIDRKPPAISVIMPVYNRALVVGDAIRSVLAQQFEDFELIVVDDGSTEDIAQIIEAFGDPRLNYERLPKNCGGNAARNRGIEAAQASLIAFLDSDDDYLPHKLGFTVRYFAQRPEIDVLLDSFIKLYPERDRAGTAIRNPVLDDNGQILDALFNRRVWKATPGIAVRRESAIKVGMFDEALRRRQDFDFILRLAKIARMATTNEINWVKSYSADTISGALESFASSAIEFYRRHPEYYANPAYRPGFAHDLGRHFSRLVKRRRFGAAWRDAKRLGKELGWARFLKLAIGGVGQFKSRRRSIRANHQEAAAPLR